MGRLLDPLLVLLLHPATARLSVLHACTLEQRTKSGTISGTGADPGVLERGGGVFIVFE